MSPTQMTFPHAAGMPISIPPLGHQLLSVTRFPGSFLSACGQLCQARRAAAASCTEATPRSAQPRCVFSPWPCCTGVSLVT